MPPIGLIFGKTETVSFFFYMQTILEITEFIPLFKYLGSFESSCIHAPSSISEEFLRQSVMLESHGLPERILLK